MTKLLASPVNCNVCCLKSPSKGLALCCRDQWTGWLPKGLLFAALQYNRIVTTCLSSSDRICSVLQPNISWCCGAGAASVPVSSCCQLIHTVSGNIASCLALSCLKQLCVSSHPCKSDCLRIPVTSWSCIGFECSRC